MQSNTRFSPFAHLLSFLEKLDGKIREPVTSIEQQALIINEYNSFLFEIIELKEQSYSSYPGEWQREFDGIESKIIELDEILFPN